MVVSTVSPESSSVRSSIVNNILALFAHNRSRKETNRKYTDRGGIDFYASLGQNMETAGVSPYSEIERRDITTLMELISTPKPGAGSLPQPGNTFGNLAESFWKGHEASRTANEQNTARSDFDYSAYYRCGNSNCVFPDSFWHASELRSAAIRGHGRYGNWIKMK
jgi:hypothetical protein